MLYKINKNKIGKKILDEAVDILRNGGVIIYPTDTAYALGCDATNEMAVNKIYKIKQRTKTKSMPVIAADLKMTEKYFIFSEKEKELAKKFWLNTALQPAGGHLKGRTEKGKLSLVLKVKKNTNIAKCVIAGDYTVAVRAPNSVWAQELSLKLGNPIISTSANLSGTVSCYSVDAIKKTGVAYENIDLILDAGILPRVMPSTIVRVKNGEIEVLREGSCEVNAVKK